MENASKALIIAGEILIALLILGILVYGYVNIKNLSQVDQDNIEIQQLTFFNKQYESYNKKLLRGVDVISIMNKAVDNNIKYENEVYYKIQIEFEIKEEIGTLKAGKYNIDNYLSTIKNNTELFTEFKRKIFDCTELKYSNDSGRVNYMKFVERIVT